MAKAMRDPRVLMDCIAENDEATYLSFRLNKPADIDLLKPEDREFAQLLSFQVAAGWLCEEEPGVFKFTPVGIEKLKETATSLRETRVERERMCRN